MRGVTSPPVLSQLLQDKTEEEEYFLKHRPHLSWEPMGSQSLGNLCEGPLAGLHPSSQVTEFTSLIMGGNRKVIGIECCHRINVSQLHINVLASLYYLCLRNTVSSKCCLSTHHQETVSTGPACPQPHPRKLELPPPFFQGGDFLLCLALDQPCWGCHYFRSQGVAAVNSRQATETPGRHRTRPFCASLPFWK